MGVKRIACATAIILPFAFLAWIGISGRTAATTYQIPGYGAAISERLYSYAPAIRAVDQIHSRLTDEEALTITLAAADVWIEGNDSGKLTNIMPAHACDFGIAGPKAEIGASKQKLVRTLHAYMVEAREEGHADDYYRYGNLALQVSEVGKHSDFSSFAESNVNQTTILRDFAAHSDLLSEADRIRLADTVASLSPSDTYRSELLKHIDSVFSSAIMSDRHYEGGDGDWVPVIVNAKSVPRTDASWDDISQWYRKTSPVLRDTVAPSMIEIARASDIRLEKAREELTQALLPYGQVISE